MFWFGVISICVVPVPKPPAAKTILFAVPLLPVAITRLPSPVVASGAS